MLATLSQHQSSELLLINDNAIVAPTNTPSWNKYQNIMFSFFDPVLLQVRNQVWNRVNMGDFAARIRSYFQNRAKKSGQDFKIKESTYQPLSKGNHITVHPNSY